MTSSPRSDGASTRPIANRDNTIPDVVYHYTDTSALMNIFATRTLWATDIGFMNDPLEYKYGANVLAALLETQLAKEQSNRNRKIEEIPIGNNRTIRMSRTEFMLTAIIERINPPLFPIHERDQEQGISGRFSVSFCDNGDLLSQWRGYAGRDGWAIGFDLSKIVESDFALSAYGISYANDMLSEGANEVANIIMK